MTSLSIFSDNLIEASWFQNLFPHNHGYAVQIRTILDRGCNPQYIEDLIQYDRPDIIFCVNHKPVLVVEKTREVPTGHNIGQRIARLVRSLEHGLPTIKFFPFDARKHGEHTGVCNLNIRILAAFAKMASIHQTPIVAVNWPSDKNGELICDGSEDSEMKTLLLDFFSSNFSKSASYFNILLNKNQQDYQSRLKTRPSYSKPPPSVKIFKTAAALKMFSRQISPASAASLKKLSSSVVYLIEMTEKSCRREDPYTGMQFIYDYTLCRFGPNPEDKVSNLILHFPKIKKDVWLSKNPNDSSRKSCNWYLIASALVFKDGSLFLR